MIPIRVRTVATYTDTIQERFTRGLPVDTVILLPGTEVSESIGDADDQDGFAHQETIHLHHGRPVAIHINAFFPQSKTHGL